MLLKIVKNKDKIHEIFYNLPTSDVTIVGTPIHPDDKVTLGHTLSVFEGTQEILVYEGWDVYLLNDEGKTLRVIQKDL